MIHDPYSVDIDMKYKQDKYLHEAVHERLLRQVNAAENVANPKRRFWVRIQIIVKIISRGREGLPQQTSRMSDLPSPLETSFRHL
ncbi:MAG: hypothetical protein FJ004_03875 [Chloroflexi bacterium]|nr:hypothetical protein [Chloroflexota bacterium]